MFQVDCFLPWGSLHSCVCGGTKGVCFFCAVPVTSNSTKAAVCLLVLSIFPVLPNYWS